MRLFCQTLVTIREFGQVALQDGTANFAGLGASRFGLVAQSLQIGMENRELDGIWARGNGGLVS